MISSRYGDPTVATIVPLADVLKPRPQVGQAKSLINNGFISPANTSPESRLEVSNTSPVVKYDRYSLDGAHVESSPGAKVIIGFVRTGPTLAHSSLTRAVPTTWRYSEGDVLI